MGDQIPDVRLAMDNIAKHQLILDKAIQSGTANPPLKINREVLQDSMNFVDHEASLFGDKFDRTNLSLDNLYKGRYILNRHSQEYSRLTNKDIGVVRFSEKS